MTAADGLARALTLLGIDPTEIVLLGVGAGTSIVGEEQSFNTGNFELIARWMRRRNQV
jgi:hypothetical protein